MCNNESDDNKKVNLATTSCTVELPQSAKEKKLTLLLALKREEGSVNSIVKQ